MSIQDEVDAGITEALRDTGFGTFRVVLRRKVVETYQYYALNAVRTKKKSWDAAAMVERTANTLLVSPLSEKPLKGDHVAFGVAIADVGTVGKWSRINNVEELNPAGTGLLYRVYLEE